jgi:VIT1/CCC1 family predicted Fe2+/Mn2+ transporter
MAESSNEEHVTLSPFVRDSIIGLADGLTVPFAIAAGLASAAASNPSIIIAAVIAEIAAGSISMGLGGYLATATEAEHYGIERKRQQRQVVERIESEKHETQKIFEEFGLSTEESTKAVESLASNNDKWVDFMMRFELGLERPDKRRSLYSAATIGGAYVVGGVIPLAPYLFLRNDVHLAFLVSIVTTLVALIIFGYIRAKLITANPWKGILQTVLVGGFAAGAAFVLAKLFA